MFKRIVMAAAAALGICVSAYAADRPIKGPVYKAAPAVFNWTGFYAGATAGFGFGDNNHANQTLAGASQTFDIDGAVAGLTIGYNWQARGSNMVWGIEFDASWSGIDGVLPVAPGFGCVGGCTTEVKWFSTLRGRLGYAQNRSLLYVTGGLAFGEVEGSIIGAIPAGSETAVGWTIGAGGEFMLNNRWSMKLEYLYIDLGDAVYAPNFAGNVIAVDNVRFSVVRLGVNHRW